MDNTVHLRRHRLVRLASTAWDDLLTETQVDSDAGARLLWQAQAWPLVVTRQLASAAGRVCLGWPLPTCWGRRRISLQVPRHALGGSALFPTLAELQEQQQQFLSGPKGRLSASASASPLASASALAALQRDLAAVGVQARVYGSYGWQAITGLAYVHAASDLDLLMDVSSDAMADAAVAVLAQPWPGLPRLDGELCFADGSGFAWREWQAWRSGRTRQILRKHLTGVGLLDRDSWRAMQVPCRAHEVCP